MLRDVPIREYGECDSGGTYLGERCEPSAVGMAKHLIMLKDSDV